MYYTDITAHCTLRYYLYIVCWWDDFDDKTLDGMEMEIPGIFYQWYRNSIFFEKNF
jgi:hypothetical protein